MTLLERVFAYRVLLGVMHAAQADGPAVGRLESSAAIRPAAHVRALNWQLHAT
nr:hypothetical protein [Parafrankia sp. BMG5.11]